MVGDGGSDAAPELMAHLITRRIHSQRRRRVRGYWPLEVKKHTNSLQRPLGDEPLAVLRRNLDGVHRCDRERRIGVEACDEVEQRLFDELEPAHGTERPRLDFRRGDGHLARNPEAFRGDKSAAAHLLGREVLDEEDPHRERTREPT